MLSFPPVTGGDGIVRPSQPYPSALDSAVFTGQRWLCYDNADSRRRVGHQHWMLAPFLTASLTNPEVAPVFEDSRIRGVVWTAQWRQLETALDTYSWTALNAALNRAQALGKQLILRILAKTYSGAYTDPVGSNPTPLAVPDYIVNDNATYGGAANRGGIYNVFLNGSAVGWGAFFERAAVRSRFNALVTAVFNQFGAHPALAGVIAPDESARSAWTGSALPSGMDQAGVIAANQAMFAHAASLFGSNRVWPAINFIDSTESIAVADQATIDHQTWAVQQGMNICISDTYPMPETARRFLQPVYYSTPRADLQPGRRTLVHVDLLSLGANDATLTQRMIGCARQTYRLGADITAWNPYTASAGGNSAYWAAMQAAIDATT